MRNWRTGLQRHLRALIRVCLIAGVVTSLLLIVTTLFIVSRFSGAAVFPADCGIVFGAAVYGSRPGPALVRRVAAAVDMYRKGNVGRLFLTGGKGEADRQTEAQAMERLAVGQGVDPRVITLEQRARSTWENLLFTRPLTGSCSSVVAISDEFHLARIELLAARQGWGSLTTFPAGVPPTPRSEFRSLLRETVAYLYYLFRIDRVWNVAPTATVDDALESVFSGSTIPAAPVN